MKRKLTICAVIAMTFGVKAQVTTIPDKIDPNDSLVLIVDLNQLDASVEHIQNLVDDATAGMGVYIWTWNPFNFPSGHPKANGTGSQEWKSSNDTMQMTDMGNLVYKYVFKPTLAEWYETDAATCYSRGFSFLVKPKDGGGYGDPDRKSDDINIAIDPPATERDPAFGCSPLVLSWTMWSPSRMRTSGKTPPICRTSQLVRCIYTWSAPLRTALSTR